MEQKTSQQLAQKVAQLSQLLREARELSQEIAKIYRDEQFNLSQMLLKGIEESSSVERSAIGDFAQASIKHQKYEAIRSQINNIEVY